MTNEQSSIKQSVQSAFRLAESAKVLRQQIAAQLPRCTGRDHGVLHRVYVTLGDMVSGFDHLSDKIAEMHALGR